MKLLKIAILIRKTIGVIKANRRITKIERRAVASWNFAIDTAERSKSLDTVDPAQFIEEYRKLSKF